VLARPTLIEGIERTNAVVVRNLLQEQEGRRGVIRRNPYVIEVNRKRSCYSYGGFGYSVRNCRNQRIIGQEKIIKYRNNENTLNSLKEKESLVVLD